MPARAMLPRLVAPRVLAMFWYMFDIIRVLTMFWYMFDIIRVSARHAFGHPSVRCSREVRRVLARCAFASQLGPVDRAQIETRLPFLYQLSASHPVHAMVHDVGCSLVLHDVVVLHVLFEMSRC